MNVTITIKGVIYETGMHATSHETILSKIFRDLVNQHVLLVEKQRNLRRYIITIKSVQDRVIPMLGGYCRVVPVKANANVIDYDSKTGQFNVASADFNGVLYSKVFKTVPTNQFNARLYLKDDGSNTSRNGELFYTMKIMDRFGKNNY